MKRIFHFFPLLMLLLLLRAYVISTKKESKATIHSAAKFNSSSSVPLSVAVFVMKTSRQMPESSQRFGNLSVASTVELVVEREGSECHSRGRKYGSRAHSEVSIVKG